MPSHIKILAIDDEPTRLHDLEEVLRQVLPEATVLTAATGTEGLALARAEAPDVIVLDTVMLDQKDYALYSAMKAEEHLRDIPICLLIAPRTEQPSRSRALLAGAEGFLVKPLNGLEVAAQLQALARSSAAARLQRAGQEQAEIRSEALRRELNEWQQADVLLRRELGTQRQIEAALRESMAMLEGIYRAAPIGIGMVVDRVFIEVNDTLCQMTGYAREELIGRNARLLYPTDEDYAYVGREKYRQIAERGTGAVETRWRRKDGEIIDIWLSSTALDPTDLSRGVVFTALDITERKRSELELRASEQRFRDLFQNMPACCFTFDRNGVIRDWNHACEVLYGWTAEQAIGKSMFELFVQEKNVALTRRNIEAVFAGRSIEGIEFEDRRADGSMCTVLANEYPLWNSEGQIEAGICVELDITERKRMEEELRQEKDRAQKYLDTAAVMMLALDVEGRVTLVNKKACEVLGYRAEELIGVDWFATCLPAADQKATWDYHVKLMSGNAAIPTYHENAVLTRAGEERWIAWHNTALTDETGRIIGVLSSGEDITERRRMEAQLRATLVELQRANADLERFAYAAAHDLQEPLRMVASYAQLLGMRYQGKLDAEADEYISFMVEGADRLQQLIYDLLVYCNIGVRGQPLASTDSNLAVQAALNDLEVEIVESGAIVECDTLPTVLADASQLVLLFRHLIGNALKFRGEAAPRVRIRARAAVAPGANGGGRFWEFAVQDNGIGIESQYFDRIFVLFQRLHTRKKYSGSGIGLALCKRIVERHGGRIWVESAPGQGSTFYFTLPAADVTAGEAQ